jgi:hypothetical protein
MDDQRDYDDVSAERQFPAREHTVTIGLTADEVDVLVNALSILRREMSHKRRTDRDPERLAWRSRQDAGAAKLLDRLYNST